MVPEWSPLLQLWGRDDFSSAPGLAASPRDFLGHLQGRTRGLLPCETPTWASLLHKGSPGPTALPSLLGFPLPLQNIQCSEALMSMR